MPSFGKLLTLIYHSGLATSHPPILCCFAVLKSVGRWCVCRLRKMVEQRQDTQRLRTWQHLLLGGISGAVAASVTMPLDYIKTATQCGSPMGAKELVRLTLREKGVRGLFAGMVRSCGDIWLPYFVTRCKIQSLIRMTSHTGWTQPFSQVALHDMTSLSFESDAFRCCVRG